MSSNVPSGNEPSTTQLLSGIITDAQELMKQQLALFRSEVREDLRKTKQAAMLMVGGLLVVHLASIVLCFMFVYLLKSQTDIPEWACYGIVGGAFALIGGALSMAAMARFNSFNPLPDQSAQAMKENVQWITNPK